MKIDIEELDELDPEELNEKFERPKNRIPKMKDDGRSVFEIKKIKDKKREQRTTKV